MSLPPGGDLAGQEMHILEEKKDGKTVGSVTGRTKGPGFSTAL